MACTCTACETHTTEAVQEKNTLLQNNQDTIRFGIAALLFIAGITLETLAVPEYISERFDGNAISALITPLIFIGAWLFAGIEVMKTLLKTIGTGSIFNEHFLMTVATVGAFVLGEWTEGAAVMIFYNLGELLQEAAVQKSRRSITNLMDMRPEWVRLYHDHNNTIHDQTLSNIPTYQHKHDTAMLFPSAPRDNTLIAPEKVQIGTLILVKAGEKVPLDGILIEGACSFDTASMTGESLPRFINKGDTVLAGFVNIDGLAVIKTTASAENTAAAKMLELVEQSQNRKSKTERLISSFARIYTPIITAGAVLLALLPPLVLSVMYGTALDWNVFAPWISRGLVFLVISCPCAFVISVPLGYFGGLGGAAKKGILIKGADFIDALSKADTVVFDKTGTLTTGILTVQHIIPADGTHEDQLLELAYIAEYHSNHPIAQAIKNYTRQKIAKNRIEAFEKATAELQEYTEKAGYGVKMRWQNHELAAGSALLIFGRTEPPSSIAVLDGTKVFISHGDVYVGCIICNDVVKPQSAQAVQELRKEGINYIEMLTGDSEATGKQIASLLQLDRCSSELLPHEKVSHFETISAERKAANPTSICVFVGDGINDAPVLARADVGIAMGKMGSDAAIEAADIVLMNDNPLLIAQAIKAARFTRTIVKQNIILSFAIKIAFLAGGAIGFIGLWAAVFADVGVALLAVCNSLRARRY